MDDGHAAAQRAAQVCGWSAFDPHIDPAIIRPLVPTPKHGSRVEACSVDMGTAQTSQEFPGLAVVQGSDVVDLDMEDGVHGVIVARLRHLWAIRSDLIDVGVPPTSPGAVIGEQFGLSLHLPEPNADLSAA
ncbi:MAG: hypothetical protein J0M19_00040 [Sphingomonadales bacterium]|nr:hypothetical protein [Sphingomonadales bacterium]